jgi:type 2 lantibiotic biosynthesis protein LanM
VELEEFDCRAYTPSDFHTHDQEFTVVSVSGGKAMIQTCFQSSAWYTALSLTERLASLRSVGPKTPNHEVNVDLAGRRMQRWRAQPPFTTGSHFAQRLAADGMTEDELLHILGEPIEDVHERFPSSPAWLVGLAQAFSRPAPSNGSPEPELPPGQEAEGFLSAIKPLMDQARERFHEGIEALVQTCANLPFDPGTVQAVLLAKLPRQLLARLSRTMVLELHVARLQGLLQGDTTEKRFRSFLQRLHQPDTALALLQEYPVLARQLLICSDNWVTFGLEFLQHLCADWEIIRTTFSPEYDPGLLVQVDGGKGDRHRGGRSVQIARFSSGLRVVYKPKALAVERHFQELLTWLNDHGDHPPFRTLKILDRGSYGWIEFVGVQSCVSPTEVQRFYQRQGGYLALLYALEATDFHHENLIATGEHPVLVDLEALFHPYVGGRDLHGAEQLASNTINHSVLRVSLLPQRLWPTAESEGIDLSGLGAVAGQFTPQPVPYWEGVGTDEMRLARQRLAMSGSLNRPTLNGTEVNALNYAEAIIEGFINIYGLLRKHREKLLADDGPLACFAGDEVRVILRATRYYAALLRESFHPDVLRDALDRDRLFDQLWVAAERFPHLARVIPAEREDLLKGDIPIFTTRPNSRDVWSSSNERIADFFDESGMTLVQQRVQQLGDADLAQQLWFVRASLSSLSGADQTKRPSHRLTEPRTLADREPLLTAARGVGDRLEALALRSECETTWIGLTFLNERPWSPMPLVADLYDGLSGVALFLAYLGMVTGQDRYTNLAQAALTTMRRQLERGQQHITSIGGFDGWGGVIYTLTHLGTLWARPALLTEAEVVVECLAPLIERDEQLDLIGGAAGCIGSLLSLYRCAPSERTLAAAIQCGDHLLAQSQAMAQGIGWVTRFTATKALTGFSHGAAGMAWALLELAALTGAERFQTAARAAIAYERSLFSHEVRNWPDLRDPATLGLAGDNGQVNFGVAWCHGASGIGLARLASLPYLKDKETRAEIDAALQTTLAQGFGSNHSLCHGDLGNLELLFQASQMVDDPQWRTPVNRMAAIILESIEREGWLCGNPFRVESPGLMTGLAGIGYGLLRLAEPARVPSVLVLAPPVIGKRAGIEYP